MRRKCPPLHLPRPSLANPGRSGLAGAATVSLVDGVKRLHQSGPTFVLLRWHAKNLRLPGSRRVQIHQADSGFCVAVSGPVDGFQGGDGRMDHLQGVVGRGNQADTADGMILWLVPVAVGAKENLQSAGDTAVLPEFFGGAGGIEGDRRLQVFHGRNRLSEGARGLNAVSGGMASVQRDAHLATEFPDGPLDLNAETLSEVFGVAVAQLGYGSDAKRLKLLGDFSANTPDVVHWPPVEIV